MTKFLYAFMFLAMMSCNTELLNVEDIEFELNQPEFAIPLINTTLSIQDALDNFDTGGFLDVDDENFMTLVYTDEVLSIGGSDVGEIKDFELPIVDTLLGIPFNDIQDDLDFDFALTKSGMLEVSFSSAYQEDLTVLVTISNLTLNSSPLIIPFNVQYTGSTGQYSQTIDLSEYKFDLQNDLIQISYQSRNAANEHRPLTDLLLTFSSIELSFAQGYVGQFPFSLPEGTLNIDLFENAIQGNIYLEDPKIKLIFQNSFGLPLQVGANEISVITAQDEKLILNSVLDQGLLINFPNLSEIDEMKETIITFDTNNSNLRDVLNSSPKSLTYEVNALTNPEEDSTIVGFISENSRINLNVEIELPLWLRANNFTLQDTADFDFSSFEEVESAEFKLITENGLPVEINVQAYFLDDTNAIVDSLFTDNSAFITGAAINQSGDVTAPGIVEKLVPMDQVKIRNLERAKKILLKSSFATSDANTTSSKFYTDYGIQFKLGARAILNLPQ